MHYIQQNMVYSYQRLFNNIKERNINTCYSKHKSQKDYQKGIKPVTKDPYCMMSFV